MILTWMFSLFLGILAGPCAIDAKNQKEKKDYGVFLSIDSSQIKKLYGYRLVVIDVQYFSAKDIRTLHKKGVKVYTYLNVGSIENFRDYYKKYEYLTIGTYENWEEEKWVDVSNKDWQKFMGKLSKKLHFVVDGVQRCTYVIKQGVYLSGIPAFRFSGYHIPVFRLDTLFCTELAQLSVNGDTCHNHNLTVFFLRTFL